MKRVIGLVVICGAASCVTSAASYAAPVRAPEHAKVAAKASVRKPAPLTAKELAERARAREAARLAAFKLLAPGDEYFGPLKLSIIGIRNTIHDLGLRYDVNHDIAKQTFASAQLAERSIRDWQHRYPKDDQLPRAIYFLQRLYTKILMQDSRDRAHATAQWLLSQFSKSPQAKQLVKTLAVEHLAPIPLATPVPTPAPTYPSEFGPGYPSEFAPSSAPTPAPSAGRAAGRAPVAPFAPASPSPISGAPSSPAPTTSATPSSLAPSPTPTPHG